MSNTLFRLKRSAVKGKTPTTSNIELGELAINTNDGRLFFKTTDSASSSAIVTLREISGGTGITETNGEISITDTGTSTGEFGSSTQIPILTVNAQGQITAINETAVAGVSALAFDSANATLTISTADGGSFNARIGLSSFSTSDLAEGTNLYYTTARANSDFDTRLATKTTDNVTEGSTNLYYTTGRFDSDLGNKTTSDLTEGSNLYYTIERATTDARNAINAVGRALDYDSATGIFTWSEVQYYGFDSDYSVALSGTTTSDLAEGTNLYYTTARADSAFDDRLATKTTDNVTEGSTNLYWTNARFDTRFNSTFGTLSTTNLAEGTNLYYTTARANSDFDTRLATKTTDDLAQGSTNLYYDSDRTITTARNSLSASGSISYNAATGVFSYVEQPYAGFDSDFGTKSTSDLTEGTNLYYTTARFDSDFGDNTTDDLAQGLTNKYYATSLFNTDFSAKSTSDLTEGTNLYYTTTRANTDFDTRLATKNTDNLSEGSTNLYYTTSRFDSDFGDNTTDDLTQGATNKYYATSLFNTDFATKTTDNLTEGSVNLYYDSARTISTARHAISASGSVSYDATTGVISFIEGSYTGFDSDFNSKSTTDLSEGNNLYYTTARADSDARSAISVVDAGGDGSLAYDSATGVLTYTGPTASEVRAHLSGSSGVNYNSSTGAITADQGEIRGLFSASDAGGDGSFSYNSSTGQFTYTGPSASEVQAHITANKGVSISSGQINIDSDNVKGMFSGGTGVTYSDGVISIGQAVGTTNDVQFAGVTASGDVVVTGNLTVNGATVTNSATNTTIEDQLIELGTGNTGSASGDAGIVIERGDDDNVFLGWDESTDRVRFATTTATGASSGNLTLTNANVEAGRFYGDLTGDVTGNADTVGNLSASQFLRSDTDDTMGGHITMSPGKNIKYQDTGGTFPTNAGKFEWVLNNDYASIHANQPSSDVIDFDFNIRDNAGSTDRFRFWIDDYRGTHKDVWQAIMSGSAAEFMMSSDSSGNRSTARLRVPLSGDVEIDSQKIWHAGNDGASSGLDADKLDGQHGSHYLDYGNFTNTPNITTTAQGAISATTSGTGHGGLTYDSSTGVMTYAKVTDANIRGAVSASGDLSYNSSTGEFSFSETYSTATEILNALKTVDTNTSGLNADTLDGQHGSYYRNASNINAGTIGDAYLPASISSNITGNAATATSAGYATNAGYASHADSATNADAASYATNAGYASYADSAGDADTLDGVQGSSYLRSDSDDTYTGILTFGSITNRLDGGDGYPLVQVSSSRAYFGSTSRAKSVIASSDTIHHVRAGTEYTIWTEYNDGAGSGLDADTLDGQQGTYYLDYNNATNTPTIGNATITISAGDGLQTGGNFTTNQTSNETITIDVDSTVVRTSGNQSITGDKNFATVIVDNELRIDTEVTTLSTTTQTQIASFAAASFLGGEFVISATRGSDREITKLMVVHDGTTASATEFANITTNVSLGEFEVDISGGNVRILATSASATSTEYKVVKNLISV